jgi:predicted O-methyltransferase YrrM
VGNILSYVGFLLRERSLRPYYDYKNRSKKLGEFLGRDATEVDAVLAELDSSGFLQELGERLAPYSNIKTGSMLSPLRAPVMYSFIRLFKPETVVETGVASGVSTAVILKAMSANGRGRLYSIDLKASPETDPFVRLPPGKQPGWLVPEDLQDRWEFHAGKSSDVLPALLPKLGAIDVFIHDSLHTYENMRYEYREAYPYVRSGGVIASDDVTWNSAWPEMVQEVQPLRTTDFYALGFMMKR